MCGFKCEHVPRTGGGDIFMFSILCYCIIIWHVVLCGLTNHKRTLTYEATEPDLMKTSHMISVCTHLISRERLDGISENFVWTLCCSVITPSSLRVHSAIRRVRQGSWGPVTTQLRTILYAFASLLVYILLKSNECNFTIAANINFIGVLNRFYRSFEDKVVQGKTFIHCRLFNYAVSVTQTVYRRQI